MFISREATAALNEYLDRVNFALPLAPSRRAPIVDKLYHQIMVTCETKAHEANKLEIDIDVMRNEIDSLGPAERQADQLLADERRWSAEGFSSESASFNERVSDFAKAAAERGEHVVRVSIETAAHALGVAAQKLHEAADRIKART